MPPPHVIPPTVMIRRSAPVRSGRWWACWLWACHSGSLVRWSELLVLAALLSVALCCSWSCCSWRCCRWAAVRGLLLFVALLSLWSCPRRSCCPWACCRWSCPRRSCCPWPLLSVVLLFGVPAKSRRPKKSGVVGSSASSATRRARVRPSVSAAYASPATWSPVAKERLRPAPASDRAPHREVVAVCAFGGQVRVEVEVGVGVGSVSVWSWVSRSSAGMLTSHGSRHICSRSRVRGRMAGRPARRRPFRCSSPRPSSGLNPTLPNPTHPANYRRDHPSETACCLAGCRWAITRRLAP